MLVLVEPIPAGAPPLDRVVEACYAESIWDVSNDCIRTLWFTTISVALILLYIFASLPIPYPTWLRTLKSSFDTFLPLEDAEAILAQSTATHPNVTSGVKPAAPQESPADPETSQDPVSPAPETGAQNRNQLGWRTVLLVILTLSESVTWLALGSYRLYGIIQHHFPVPDGGLGIAIPFSVAFVWLYAAIRIFIRPPPIPPYDVFALLVVRYIQLTWDVGAVVYRRLALNYDWPKELRIVAILGDFVAVNSMLLIILGMPLGVPSQRVIEFKKNGGRVMEEDYTTLWGWITFNWINDLIERGTKTDLEETDVPELSPSVQSRTIYQRFMEYRYSTLLRQLLAANFLDLVLDSSLTLISVVCNYSSPFLLKLVLEDIEQHKNPGERSQAYIYAILMFLSQVLKAEVDVQHLWFSRRATTRARTELMAAIYVKALRRKDFSGIVKKDAVDDKDADKTKSKKAADDAKEKEDAKGGPKAGADTGKIVQLMAADANRIAMMVSAAYMIYSAPMEIIIASIMLYRLLGWAAFAGFGVMVIALPINHLLSKRGVTISWVVGANPSLKISRGLSAARDKRMGVLNELIGGVKFIKFFAWEAQWVKRAQDARQYELGWLIKDRINSTLFSFLWSLAPTFVSIVSFFAYIYAGNELSISTAFTAIALFNMLKMPLNVIPMFIVMFLQAGVALDRIATFLQEEEVPDHVSSFKRPILTTNPSPEDYEIGITGGASFAWNEVKEPPPSSKKKDTKGKSKSKSKSRNATPALPTVTVTREGTDATAVEVNAPSRFELRDVDVMFPVGKLTLVVGPTASGKSALLMALLGEMTPLDSVSPSPIRLPKNPYQVDPSTGLRNAISYCAQTPWLEHASIKQNILFYEPFEEERYQEVLRACALLPDLNILEDGDETEIGARGVSLSGGQKARVALARAVYSRTKHVILDDPLAAVDSHTARHLYEHVLQGPLMKDRTCILVTHHVDLVRPAAYYLVRMLDGRVDTQGTIEDLEAHGILDMIMEDSVADKSLPDGTSTPSDDAETVAEAVIENKPVEEVREAAAHARTETETTAVAGKKKPRKLVKDEERAKGNVKWNIYKTYLQAAGWGTWVWLVLCIGGYQGLGIIEKLWIKAWGEHYGAAPSGSIVASSLYTGFGIDHTHTTSHDIMGGSSWGNVFMSSHVKNQTLKATGVIPELPSAEARPMFYVGIYAAIGVIAALVSVSNSIVQYIGSYRASKILFNRLLRVVIGSPMRFFDTTPTGRILNRFSRDVETVDSSLSGSLRSTSSWLASFVAALITVVVVLPRFFIPAVFIAYMYYRLSYGYIVAGRSLRRMESTTRSPIFAAFGDTLEGLVTVRAFSKELTFVDGTHIKIDLTTKMWYSFWMLNRWLLLRFDSLGAVSTFFTSIFALAKLDAGLAGLTITSAMAFMMAVYWTCRMVTQLEMDLNSVERVVEYLDLPQEPPAIVESNRAPAYWPSSSAEKLVVVEDLVIRYAPELPPVLHDVSFALSPKERVGLLGRTGSGKSTLAMALLRFVEPSGGRIIVDGIDISTIGLHDVRSRLTIIPQDAVLFSGTIRKNLDPFNEHSDEECLDALARVHINTASGATSLRASRAPSVHENQKDAASIRSGATQLDESKQTVGLQTKVSAGGANFSQGQRQLIALARALLRRSAIIIMDEATSSIDFKTDSLVQSTIRDEFQESLLITIAHRIRTIIDYDRLIVLDQGRIVEFDTPYNLINKEDGVFRAMPKVLVTGANDFVAFHALKFLFDRGYSVVGTVRSERKFPYIRNAFQEHADKLDLSVVEDITVPGAFDKVIKEHSPDAVFHIGSPFVFDV
ncbi:hypothetical protein FRB99_000095 [Tulasnella sp. 403]|nr:hypothetical protein FRB99_000095 [Tulasnella sp. 403]